MNLDANEIFSDSQVITATAASTNYQDFKAPGFIPYYAGSGAAKTQLRRRLGKEGNGGVPLLIQVTEDFNNLTSLQIDIETDDNSAFSSPKVVVSQIVLLADLKAGFISSIDKLPREIKERYMRIKYTVVGTAPTTGKVFAGIVGAVDGAYSGNK